MDWNSARLLVLPLLLAVGSNLDLCAAGPSTPPAGDKLSKMLREAALALLQEGNHRFAQGRPQHPNQGTERRVDVAQNGQNPLATILACADSSAPVERIFDRGVGDLFVVRGVGNVATESELASIEYGVNQLQTPVLIVLGHTQCGVVSAVVQGTEFHGHLPTLAALIKPAVAHAKPAAGSDQLSAAIKANVWSTLERILTECPDVKARADAGQLSVQAAVYHLDSGTVEWLGSPSAAGSEGHRGVTETVTPANEHTVKAPAAVPEPAVHVSAATHPETRAEEPEHKPAQVRPVPAASGSLKPFRPALPEEDSLLLNPPISGTAPIGAVVKKPAAVHKAH